MKIIDKSIISDELIESTYLYCYKRLNSPSDAEDLAQDILLEALKSIKSGKQIHSFYPWFWQLAHNRYCTFLRMKKNQAVSLEVYGGTLSCDLDFTEEIIAEEDIALLNYTLSRLSSLHRQSIILYYLKQKKISEIADELGIPEGTVKRRLFDAKTEIKKGVTKMNIGKSSYAPADLQMWGGYGAPKYWNQITDLMTSQIFVACREKSATIKEIADEIGVAPVYFEDKLKYLLDNKFLKEESNGRYLTDFCILPRQLYADFSYELSLIYCELGKEITDAIKDCEKEIRALDFYGNDLDYSYLLWILYVYACTVLQEQMLPIYRKEWEGKVPDNNGKDYRFAGTVAFPDEEIVYKGSKQASWSNIHYNYQTSNYSHIAYANLFQHNPFPDRDKIINENNINTIMKIFENPNASLTAVDENHVAFLISKGYARKDEKGIYLTFPVLTYECRNDMYAILTRATSHLVEKYVKRVSELGDRMLLPHIRKDLLEEYVIWIMGGSFFPLSYVLYYAINEDNTLAIPEDYSRSAAAVCMYYKK